MPSGRWKQGQSGNPGGRPKDDARLRELARERTEDALNTLTAIMTSRKAPAAARVAAACAILDRGYGRPSQQLQHTGPGDGTMTLEMLVAASFELENLDRSRIPAGSNEG